MDKCPTNPWCPKCGFTVFNVDYRPAAKTFVIYAQHWIEEEEYLRWQCQRCGWVYLSHPKDYKESKE